MDPVSMIVTALVTRASASFLKATLLENCLIQSSSTRPPRVCQRQGGYDATKD